MLEPGFLHRLTKILVASEAKLVPRLHEVPFVICTVRIVAGGAFPFRDDLVPAARFFRRHLVVAFQAYPTGIGVQEFSMRGGVGIMTSGTIPCFYRRMEERTLELILEGLVAVYAELPFCAGFEIVLIRGEGRAGDEKSGEHHQEYKGPASHVRPFPLHWFSPATWQSPQERAANGGCVTSLKSFGSVEAWGVWQLMQFMTPASM